MIVLEIQPQGRAADDLLDLVAGQIKHVIVVRDINLIARARFLARVHTRYGMVAVGFQWNTLSGRLKHFGACRQGTVGRQYQAGADQEPRAASRKGMIHGPRHVHYSTPLSSQWVSANVESPVRVEADLP